MTPERWQQIKAVLDDALERDKGERTAFLDDACAGDHELREEVESLLASEDEVEDFIETPVFRIHPDGWEPLASGQRIGAYRILREIGRGGMGAVYLAERDDQEFDRRVAIKVVRRGMDTDEIVRRFRSERQILARLDHPNIAQLFDGGTTEDGRPYFVMEHVEGQPIDQYCDERKLPTRERLELFRQVCAAVHFAHQNLIVHRDLKPGNILVTADGVPKLLDFGIAKLLGPEDLLAPTRLDLRPMTPEYASPEQVRGEPVTTASDVYALGVLLYVLLTGHRPYRPATGDPNGLAKAICETDPPRPSTAVGRTVEVKRSDGSVVEVTPGAVSQVRDGEERLLRRRLAGDLDNIVLMAMRKDPQRRYASVDQFSNDIGRHLEGLPVIARKDTLGYRTAKFVGRHKLGVAVAALFLLLIIGFTVGVTVLWQRAVREKARSEAISEFLQNLFAIPDPSQSHGEEVTARQVLDAGVDQINTSLQGQPELRADLMETMGKVYRNLGLYPTATKLLKTSLDLRQKALSSDDPRIAINMQNLANALREAGDNTAAEPLIREALRLQRRNGEDHTLDYAKGLNNLGAILEARGELDEAEQLYEESIAVKKSLPEFDEDDVAGNLNNLGALYSSRSNYGPAKKYFEDALAIRHRQSKGKPDPRVASVLSNIASMQEDQRDLAAAKKTYREVLDIRRALYPGANAKVARSLNNYGHILEITGDFAGAEKHYREAIAMADETLAKDHHERGYYLRNLASSLLAQGKAEEAEGYAQEALTILQHADPPIPWRIADAESLLGACLTDLGRYAEAEPLLTKGYAVLVKDKEDGAKRAPDALKRLINLYTAWGKPEKAAEYQAKLPAPAQTASAQR